MMMMMMTPCGRCLQFISDDVVGRGPNIGLHGETIKELFYSLLTNTGPDGGSGLDLAELRVRHTAIE
jgi:hypothetical protein